jgi:hypothetical protein
VNSAGYLYPKPANDNPGIFLNFKSRQVVSTRFWLVIAQWASSRNKPADLNLDWRTPELYQQKYRGKSLIPCTVTGKSGGNRRRNFDRRLRRVSSSRLRYKR